MMKGKLAYALFARTFSSKVCPVTGSMFQSEITKPKCFSDIFASCFAVCCFVDIFGILIALEVFERHSDCAAVVNYQNAIELMDALFLVPKS